MNARRSSIWLLATTAAIALWATLAGAVQRDQDVTGRWTGYFDSASVAGARGALTVDISWQDGRRFGGEVCVPPDPCTPVMGTISASGEITLTGRSPQVRSIEMHGAPVDPHSRNDSAIAGAYRIMRAGGSLDQGNLVLVHQGLENDVPFDLQGGWGGQATPEGTAAARPVHVVFEIDRTGAIQGNLGWATADRRSQVVGQTLRDTNGADGIALVGLLDDAIVVANLAPSGLVRESGRLEGTYRRLTADGGRGSAESGHIVLFYNRLAAASKQTEARANLKALYTAEKAFFQEKDRYSTHVNEVGYAPERNNRYRYVLTANPTTIENRSGIIPISMWSDEGVDVDLFKYPQSLYATLTHGPCSGTPVWGITGNGPYVFVGAAYGNVDGDDTLDIWSISTAGRWLSGPDCDAIGYVPAGEPANDLNDVNR